MVKTQPGFYRLMLGEFEITAMNDGVIGHIRARNGHYDWIPANYAIPQ